MTNAFAIRLSLSAIAVASIAIVLLNTLRPWPAAAALPFEVEQGAKGYVVHPIERVPLPSPLVDGDILAPEKMTPVARATVLYGLSIPTGSSVGIAVSRDGRILRASVPARAASLFRSDWLRGVLRAFVFLPFLAALALLTLWRGRDRVASGLCCVSFYALIGGAALSLGNILPEPRVTFWLVLLVIEGQYLVAGPALYVIAEALAGAGLAPRTRHLARVAVACSALAAFALSSIRHVAIVDSGIVLGPAVASASHVLILTVMAIAVLMLLAGYRRAPHENRLRIRWVLLSTAYLLVCAVIILALEPVQNQHPLLFQFVYTVRSFALAGYLYAAIRTRLVDISFVVNRALVYAGITALLFGVFSVFELGLHQLAVSDKLSWALQAIAALLLAMALSPLHRRLEHWVERIFFRRQRLAIASVRTFAAECAFIEQQSRLLETAVTRLHPHCDAVAIYERAPSGYQLRASRGRAWPETVDVDDPAFVSLRARRQEVDLRGLGSAIGSESLAFPMVVGETLSGAVVCHPRAGEQLAPDVRAALAEASHKLGASLYILRYREQARLVADIAAGRIDEIGARQRAIAMLEGVV